MKKRGCARVSDPAQLSTEGLPTVSDNGDPGVIRNGAVRRPAPNRELKQ